MRLDLQKLLIFINHKSGIILVKQIKFSIIFNNFKKSIYILYSLNLQQQQNYLH